MRLNIQNQFDGARTIATTDASTYAVKRPAAGTHPEDTMNPLGLFVAWSAMTLAGSNSYQFQVFESTAATPAGQLVVADTGTMLITDPRLIANPGVGYGASTVNTGYIFLPIDWGLVTLQYLYVEYTLAGNGTPSVTILGSWLCNTSDVPRFTTVPANYTA